jgi:hypothetical protein
MEIGRKGIPHASTPPLDERGTIVKALEELVPHLDDTLTHLCLPPKMAMQCLGYWLLRFLRIQDRGSPIALRFANTTNGYITSDVWLNDELAGQMSNIFLVFGGVQPAAGYDKVEALVDAENTDWVEELDIDIPKMQDKGNFRLIAWEAQKSLLRK